MGICAGFDMVPPLSTSKVDKLNWESFMEQMKQRYQDDDLVEIKRSYIKFKVAEQLLLPFDGHKFLSFSSKISGSQGGHAENYIRSVTKAARNFFDARVISWNETFDTCGSYSWVKVRASIESYEQGDTSETSTVSETERKPELDSQLFEVQWIPGKGKGLRARSNIAKGTRIFCEKPLIVTAHPSSNIELQSTIAMKRKVYSKTQDRQFLSLVNNFPSKYPLCGIFKSNALPCGPNSSIRAIYPTISLINHSCQPNAHHNWNSDTEFGTIHATRFIHSGSEITISYGDNSGPTSDQAAYLRDIFGFDCHCDRRPVTANTELRYDDRRRKVLQLDEAVSDHMRRMDRPNDCLEDCSILISNLEKMYQGGAAAWIARLYYVAFHICIMHSDEARASVFAGRAYKQRVICEGEDSPETKKMKEFMTNPAGHASFGMSKQWKTAKELEPYGGDNSRVWDWFRSPNVQVDEEQADEDRLPWYEDRWD